MWNVKQMVKNQQSKTIYTPLLSDYTATFWTEYKNNCNDYDNYFKTLYKSFVFFDQDDDDTIDNVCTNFTATIKNYLRANDKRLSELWRINVVPDDESYNIAENYYREDIYTKTGSGSSSSSNGQRTDTKTGSISSSETNGSKTDTRTIDAQNSGISGQRTDINDTTQGMQSIRNNDNVTGFNSNDTKRRGQTEQSIGSRNDITQFTQGKQESTASSHNEENFVQGSQQNTSTSQNSESFVQGSQTNTSTSQNNENYTLVSHGAIGTMAVADLLEKNEKYWANTYIFYEFVFREICEKFLIIGD